eukprot:scaffold7540_cov118-Isochrysis_galbana.AAC.1
MRLSRKAAWPSRLIAIRFVTPSGEISPALAPMPPALSMRPSSLASRLAATSAAALGWLTSSSSISKVDWTSGSLRSCSTACSARCWLRQARMIRLATRSVASWRHASRPSPMLAPVTRTVRAGVSLAIRERELAEEAAGERVQRGPR